MTSTCPEGRGWRIGQRDDKRKAPRVQERSCFDCDNCDWCLKSKSLDEQGKMDDRPCSLFRVEGSDGKS
jgi:hypothetical protein